MVGTFRMTRTFRCVLSAMVSIAMVCSLCVPYSFADDAAGGDDAADAGASASAVSGGAASAAGGQEGSAELAGTPADQSPYDAVASIGDSISAGYGPLMNDNTWYNYVYGDATAGSYPYELTQDLGLDVGEDLGSLLCVEQRVIDAYYAIGGDPDRVVDPDSLDSEFEGSYTTVEYLEEATTFHGERFMGILGDLRESGEGAQRVEEADLVTVMIGLADLALYPVNRTITGGSYDVEKALKMIGYSFQSYETYYPKLIERIQELNPEAEICVLSLYNPYTKLVFEGEDDQRYYDAVAAAVDLLNAQLAVWSARYGCTFVDITGVEDYIGESTTVPAGGFVSVITSCECHPGAAGHKYIENRILDALELERASKTPSANSAVDYLAFTSDIHNADSNSSGERLDAWIDGVSGELGDITFDYLGCCGDIGSASLSSTAYLNKVQMVMDAVNENVNVQAGIYTTGNHEYSPGSYAEDAECEPYASYTRLGEAADTDTYRIYCFGAAQYDQQFAQEDIDALAAYLEQAGKDEPVFVLSHFPLHSYGGESTENADAVIEVLNRYPNVVFIWGHAHTLSDTHYDTVCSGELDGTPIGFVYCAAGCMSDADYSAGSGSVAGKGLVAAIDGDGDGDGGSGGSLTLTYYDAQYRAVSSYVVDISDGSALEVDCDGDLDVNFDNGVYSAASALAEGEYVFAVGRTAMNGAAHAGYTCVNGGGTYSYSGLQGAAVAVSSGKLAAGLTEDEVWTVAETAGGYTVRNKADGRYLTGRSSDAGAELVLEDEAGDNGVWVYEDAHLKNVATGAYLNFDVDGDVDGDVVDGETNLFTLRSAASDAVSLYSAAADYEARFGEETATVSYGVKLADGEGDLGALSLCRTEERYPVDSGAPAGTLANRVDGYAFLYWTSDEDGTDIVARTRAFTPENTGSDAVYYAWYRKGSVCSETVTEGLPAVAAGTHRLFVDGDDLGEFVFTEELGGWTLYSTAAHRFLSVSDGGELVYSSVSEVWSYDGFGFSVVYASDVPFAIPKTYYLVSWGGEPGLWTYPASSTKLADVYEAGYSSHAAGEVTGTTGETHTFVCTRCGETVTQAHGFSESADNGDGTHSETCAVCGYEKVSAHTAVADAAVAATCEEPGLSEGSHCSECGAVIVAQKGVAALGHNYGEWTVTREATLGAAGERCRICERCEGIEVEAVPALASISLVRLSGAGRYDTMAAVSAAGFEHADVVVVACGENFPDALSATGLAGLYDAPVLLSSDDALSQQTASEIRRLGATHAILIGGTVALSEEVEDGLADMLGAGNVVRIAGANRVDTALEVYEYGCIPEEGKASWSDDAIVAASYSFADALSASPYSFAKHAPILLTDASGDLTEDVSSALSGFSRVLLVGGETVVSAGTESALGDRAVRLSGSNRYATSAAIAAFGVTEGLSANGFALATGANYPDALAGGALCGRLGSVVLLVADDDDAPASAFLGSRRSSISSGYVLGGAAAVSDSLKARIEQSLAGM